MAEGSYSAMPHGEDPAYPVLALLPDAGARATLRLALSADLGPDQREQIGFCGNVPHLLKRSTRFPPSVVVASINSRGPALIASLRRQFPLAGLVAWLRVAEPRDVRALLDSGADSIVLPHEGQNAAAVAELVISARTARLVRLTEPVLKATAPPTLLPLMESLLRRAFRRISVAEAADLFCATPETLRRHLARAGFPSPMKLINWFRLFYAGLLLENRRRTVENVASVLDFPSRTALENQLKRYANRTATDLRATGALRMLTEDFERRHRQGNWELGLTTAESCVGE